jgi:hypothetical protein
MPPFGDNRTTGLQGPIRALRCHYALAERIRSLVRNSPQTQPAPVIILEAMPR